MNETTPDAGGPGTGGDFGSIITGLFGLASKKIETDAAARASQVWRDQQLYGIDEYGRPYYRGTTYPGAAPLGLSSGALLLGVGAIALIVFALKD